MNRIASLLMCLLIILPTRSPGQLAKGRTKFLGFATSSSYWPGLTGYWNQVTSGNEGKWEFVEGIRGSLDFTNLDKIYDFAINNGILFKEHALVWGNQQPSWIAGLDTAQQRIAVENWISQVGKRYGSIAFADVVNEPFHAPPSYKNALGGDGATGWDWVIRAFQLARQSCIRGVKLVLNEYNILHDNTATTNYINLITLLKDRGLIDVIGVQGHYFEFRSDMDATSGIYVYDVNGIRSNLDRLAALGLPIHITEFDVDEAVDANQLASYKVYFPLFWDHPSVKGITVWGYIENDVWTAHPYTYLIRNDYTERPALQWMRRYVGTPPRAVLISPVGGTGLPRNTTFVWHPSESAKSYHVQVSTSSAFSTILIDTLTADTLLQVQPLAPNTRYYWHVAAANDSGESSYTNTAYFVTGDQLVAVEETSVRPIEYVLGQNYPNPFNPETVISYQSPVASDVRLIVYDLLGREVAVLMDETKAAGTYEARFDATGLSSGVYVYRLTAGKFSASGKMVLAK